MLTFRDATDADLPTIVEMLADDPLGALREHPGDPAYATAFAAIAASPNDTVLLAVDGAVLGCLQLTFLPGLSRTGMWRGHIEGVRVHRDARGRGVGRALVEAAIARCVARGCGLVQLTTDASRTDARRFYEGLGFVASHVGMKRAL